MDDKTSGGEEIEKEIVALPDSSGGEWNEMSEEEVDESEFFEEVTTFHNLDWVFVEFKGKKTKLFYVF